jgi:hypothetical protein
VEEEEEKKSEKKKKKTEKPSAQELNAQVHTHKHVGVGA